MAVIAISNFLPLLSGFGKRHKFHATLVRILTNTDLVRTFVSENLRVQDFNEVTSIRSWHHLEQQVSYKPGSAQCGG